MVTQHGGPVDVLIVAEPETAASALYGLYDVLALAGTAWQQLAQAGTGRHLFSVRIASTRRMPFDCSNGVPVRPDLAIGDDPAAAIIVLPEVWLAPDDSLQGRYAALVAWLRRRYEAGSAIYAACSGTIILAETGLLDGRDATSHWAYADLFRAQYPAVRFRPEPSLVFAEDTGRIVTAGGSTSWHDLALHLIARYGGMIEASRTAQVFLLKWHDEGQQPYTPLVRNRPHGDAVVRESQQWLAEHYRETGVLQRAIERSRIPSAPSSGASRRRPASR